MLRTQKHHGLNKFIYLFIALFFILGLPLLTYAQEITVNGRVMFQGTPIQAANVLLTGSGNEIKQLLISDAQGNFKMTASILSTDKMIARYIGYKSDTIRFKNITELKSSIDIIIKLIPDSMFLDEVVINQSSKEKDTVDLNIYHNATNETTLREILSKQSNFRIGEDGSIIYKGKNIDKITINNKPAFISQNSLALDNIENKIIKRLSLINNYSNSFSLQLNEEKESILNIDTKDDYSTVSFGKLTGGIGFKEKAMADGNLFNFSKNLNAFIFSNTNNIGKLSMQQADLNSLVKKYGNELSSFHVENLNEILLNEQAILKNLMSNNSVTIRNESNKYRTSAEVYFIAHDKKKTNNTSVFNEGSTQLLNQTNSYLNIGKTMITNLDADFILAPNKILSYNFSLNLINDKNNIKQTNTRFLIDSTSFNKISAVYNENISSIFNQIKYSVKINKNILSNSEFKWFNDGIRFPKREISDDLKAAAIEKQNLSITNNWYTASSEIVYKITDEFIPKLGVEFQRSKEFISNISKANESHGIDRNSTDISANIAIDGNKLFGSIKYQGNLSLMNKEVITANSSINSLVTPVKFNAYYENKLNRALIEIQREINLLDLRNSTNFLQSDLSAVNGNINLSDKLKTTNSIRAGYFRNNLFEGETYGLEFSYLEDFNNVVLGLTNIDLQGIQHFNIYLVPKSNSYKYQGNLGRIVFKNTFPLKLDVILSYTKSNGIAYLSGNSTGLINKQYISGLKFETVLKSNFGLEGSSILKNQKTKFGNDNIVSAYLKNLLTLKYLSQKIEFRLSFVHEDFNVLERNYTRKNFHLNFNYKLKNYSFGIYSQNIDDLFNLFKNQSYNNVLNVKDGISSLTTSNQYLSYLILNITYNFKL